MKIRTKFGLSLSGMLALSFTVALVAVGWVLKQMVSSQIEGAQKAQVQMLASVSQQALVLKDELFLLNYVRRLSSEPGVGYAYFVDSGGKILVHTDPQFVYQPLEKWTSSGRASPALERESDVLSKDGKVGVVRIGFSEEFTRAAVRESWRKILSPITGIAIGGIFLSLLLGIAISHYMSRSIRSLAQASREIASGNLAAEAPIGSADELGELAKQFNSMAQQLRKIDEMKAEFISIVSHDLRSPLGAIIAYSEHLMSADSEPLSDDQRLSVQTITDQCWRLTHMVNNILDMGKLQSGRMEEFLREPFDVAKTAEEVRNLFASVAKKKNVSLTVSVDPRLPPAMGDAEKIQQVVTNLLSNALKFTPSGGTIVIGAAQGKDGGLQIFVRDTGPGIPPDELPRIFERFHQVNVEDQRAMRIRGTGLGLAISRGFVEALGGRIWVESALGRGTQFSFTLPRAQDGAKEKIVATGRPGSGLLPSGRTDAA